MPWYHDRASALREVVMIQFGTSLLRSVFVCLLIVAGVTGASAQVPTQYVPAWTDRGFFSFNIGAQPDERQSIMRGSVPLHGGTASYEAAVPVESGGIFDIGGAWRVWQNVGAGLTFSFFSDTSDTTVTATIPDPLVTDSPHTDSQSVSGLKQSENAIHLSVVYMIPIKWVPKLHLAVSAGPSFFNVDKDIVSSVGFTEGSTTMGAIETTRLSETATGGHIAFDLQYTLVENVYGMRGIGAGFLFRYAKASVDAAGIEGNSFDVGGVHVGGGLRVRF
jgi:hypothetical protein